MKCSYLFARCHTPASLETVAHSRLIGTRTRASWVIELIPQLTTPAPLPAPAINNGNDRAVTSLQRGQGTTAFGPAGLSLPQWAGKALSEMHARVWNNFESSTRVPPTFAHRPRRARQTRHWWLASGEHATLRRDSSDVSSLESVGAVLYVAKELARPAASPRTDPPHPREAMPSSPPRSCGPLRETSLFHVKQAYSA